MNTAIVGDLPRAEWLLALLLGLSLASVAELSPARVDSDCKTKPNYLTDNVGNIVTDELGNRLTDGTSIRECELKMGEVRLPLPQWASGSFGPRNPE